MQCARPLNKEMCDVLETLEQDPAVKVLVLTGAGESWSAGMDLKEYFRETDGQPEIVQEKVRREASTWQWGACMPRLPSPWSTAGVSAESFRHWWRATWQSRMRRQSLDFRRSRDYPCWTSEAFEAVNVALTDTYWAIGELAFPESCRLTGYCLVTLRFGRTSASIAEQEGD